MQDFLSHNEAPISDAQWDAIDKTVIDVAQRQLVGRRFLNILGPLGAGVQWITQDRLEGVGVGHIDTLGETTYQTVETSQRSHLPIPLIYKDFVLYWRDVETSKHFGTPLDLSAAAGAASECARAEDEMIFHGVKSLNIPGLLTVEGRQTLPQTNWDETGGIFNDVIKATEQLARTGFYAPYAMVVPPHWYSRLHRTINSHGMLEIEHIRQIITNGVFFSSVLPENQLMIVSTGVQNFDLAVAQDFKTAYLGAQNMNHPFRVLASLVLRIKRPGAICVLTA
jgi:uncharacterized linocin/CFP29 family protein